MKTELRNRFTTKCLGKCNWCKVDIEDAVPTTYDNDLWGTCFDYYDGQILYSWDLSDFQNYGIKSSKRNLDSQGDDIVFNLDLFDNKRYPQKVGY